jgi:peptidoglycan/LPS O-acetylase OafA/YrhL
MQEHRSDIDGLRALAVLSVVLFHSGFGTFAGGFTGVDVFFTISGYVITRKLTSEIRRGEFSFERFYIGRARRLFPAFFVTLAVTFVSAVLLLSPDHLQKLAQSTVFAALAVSNIYFWQEAGYWDLESTLKPLLHTWSLSVEEQFYLIWPAILVGAGLSRRSGRFVSQMLFVAAAASLALAAAVTPETAFYLMPCRIFEFALGAVLVWLLKPENLPQGAPETLALTGLVLILYPVLAFTSETPVAGMLVPCFGTAMLIFAGPKSIVCLLWNNRAAVWVGRISYSLYLVHWPLIVLYQYWRFEPIHAIERFGLVLGAFVLAIPLHHLVERRYRYAATASASAKPFGMAWAGLTSALVCAGVFAWSGDGWPRRIADREILAKTDQPLCVNEAGLCKGGSPQVVLIGDSHAAHYAVAVAEMLKEHGVRGELYEPGEACSFLIGTYSAYRFDEQRPCPDLQKKWLARLQEQNPRIVILAGFWEFGIAEGFGGRLTDGTVHHDLSTEESRALFDRKITEVVALLTEQGRKVVLMGNGPLFDRSPSICYSRPKYLGRFDCSKGNALTDQSAHAFVRAVFARIASIDKDVFFFDAYAHLCEGTHCRQSLYADRHHLTPYGAMWLQQHAFGDLTAFLDQSTRRESASAH